MATSLVIVSEMPLKLQSEVQRAADSAALRWTLLMGRFVCVHWVVLSQQKQRRGSLLTLIHKQA